MKKVIRESLEAVHTHTHTSSFKNRIIKNIKIAINTYKICRP
jgi:hypothetical protein